jgi:hypothetical protein
MRRAVGIGLWVASLAACTNDATGPCSVRTNAGCAAELQCETVEGRDEPTCLPPVVVRGHVYDLTRWCRRRGCSSSAPTARRSSPP